MSTGWIVLIVVLVILVALIIGLYFLGKRAEKKQEEQNAQVEATAQNVTKQQAFFWSKRGSYDRKVL